MDIRDNSATQQRIRFPGYVNFSQNTAHFLFEGMTWPKTYLIANNLPSPNRLSSPK